MWAVRTALRESKTHVNCRPNSAYIPISLERGYRAFIRFSKVPKGPESGHTCLSVPCWNKLFGAPISRNKDHSHPLWIRGSWYSELPQVFPDRAGITGKHWFIRKLRAGQGQRLMFDQRPEPPGPHERKVALGSSPSPRHNFIQQPMCKCLCARHREHEETADTGVLLQEVQDPQTGSKGPLPRGRGRNTVPFSILAKAGPPAPQACPIPFRHLCL